MTKMQSKKFLVLFLVVVGILFSLTFTSASEIANIYSVEVNGVYALNNTASVLAGETVNIKVFFNALKNASEVRVKAEIDGVKTDVSDKTSRFDVEGNYIYKKTLSLRIPSELEDEISDSFKLIIKVWNKDDASEKEIFLRVQRPAYKADVISISANQKVDAGSTLPIDVTVKNIGYNKLDDLYVTVEIPEIGIKRTSYFGDIVSRECYDEEGYCKEDDKDAVTGRFYLKIPYNVEAGTYNLRVEVKNTDIDTSASKQITIENEFSAGNVIAGKSKQSFAVGEQKDYNIIIANPTNKLKIYRAVVSGSSSNLLTSVDRNIIAVPAGSSRTVVVTAKAASKGEYSFDVDVFSGEKLVSTVTLSANVSENGLTTTLMTLTIILAIVFMVLLVILIVLLGKKPAKQEEFGESYY